MKYIAVLLLSLSSWSSLAALNPSDVLYEEVMSFVSPNSRTEYCFIPPRLGVEGARYSSKDLKKERELCSYNFYLSQSQGTETEHPAGLCPKVHSTNPALELFELEEFFDRAQFELAVCSKESGEKTDGDKIAKYKLSYSCSNTHSILGYYHVSRILGGVLDIPPSVLRTVDIEENYHYAQKAERIVVPSGQKCRSKDLQAQGNLLGAIWCNLREVLGLAVEGRPGRETYRDRILTTDEEFTFGALSVNPKKEEFFREFYYRSSTQEGRAERFKTESSIYQALASRAPISSVLESLIFNSENVSRLQALKDASDMILMDAIFAQADRFGNIHYRERAFTLEANQVSDEKPDSGVVEVIAKKMILKDNDCGFKSRWTPNVTLLEDIQHISKNTYTQFLRFADRLEQSESKDYFTKALAYPESDFRAFKDKVILVANSLEEKCHSGQVQVDLNMFEIFNGTNSGEILECSY